MCCGVATVHTVSLGFMLFGVQMKSYWYTLKAVRLRFQSKITLFEHFSSYFGSRLVGKYRCMVLASPLIQNELFGSNTCVAVQVT